MSWTESDEEMHRFCGAQKTLWEVLTRSFYVTVRLRDGREIRGRFSGSQITNNGTIGGRMKFSGIVTIQADTGGRLGIDILEIVAIEPVVKG